MTIEALTGELPDNALRSLELREQVVLHETSGVALQILQLLDAESAHAERDEELGHADQIQAAEDGPTCGQCHEKGHSENGDDRTVSLAFSWIGVEAEVLA